MNILYIFLSLHFFLTLTISSLHQSLPFLTLSTFSLTHSYYLFNSCHFMSINHLQNSTHHTYIYFIFFSLFTFFPYSPFYPCITHCSFILLLNAAINHSHSAFQIFTQYTNYYFKYFPYFTFFPHSLFHPCMSNY
jgi:hypothetical protein